ncbi:unnamed protein product [Mortierella alpina]
MQQASGTSASKTGKAAGPAAAPSRRGGGQGLFSATNTHTGTLSTANAAATGSTGGMQDRLSQRSIRALSALSLATGISNNINASTVANKDRKSAVAASFDDRMNNPFMEQPPRKVMKRDHVTTTAASDSVHHMVNMKEL